MIAVEAIDAPFMIDTATSPVVPFLHKRSALPSPLKSPVPARVQASGTLPTSTDDVIVVPFIRKTTTSPVDVFRQTMSALPSPLKSPTPPTAQAVGMVVTSVDDAIATDVGVPVSVEMIVSPVDVLRHNMSLRPSPLKSPEPATA